MNSTTDNPDSPPDAAIVSVVDDGFLPAYLVMLRSIAEAHGDAVADLRLVALHRGGLSDRGQGLVDRLASRLGFAVDIRQVPPPDPRFPEFRTGSDTTYTRFAIPEAVPEYNRVLYMDVDVIVGHDLRPLLHMDLGGASFAAVPDPVQPRLRFGPIIPGWEELGLDPDREYFNNGILLMDVARCVKQDLFGRSARFLVEHPEHILYWDQCAMNWAADQDDWLRLDRRWNTYALAGWLAAGWYEHRCEEVLPLAMLLADEADPAILHFAGPDKPWEKSYPECESGRRFQRLAQMPEMQGLD